MDYCCGSLVIIVLILFFVLFEFPLRCKAIIELNLLVFNLLCFHLIASLGKEPIQFCFFVNEVLCLTNAALVFVQVKAVMTESINQICETLSGRGVTREVQENVINKSRRCNILDLAIGV